MKKEKLGFFKKLFLVITDFRTYPFLVKHEKFIKSILYLFILTAIVALVLATNISFKLTNALDEIIKNYNDIIPEFELSDGTLNVSDKYNEKIDSESFLVVNTDCSYNEFKETKEYSSLIIYDMLILVNNDRIIIETENEPLYEISFENLGYETNKNGLYNELTRIYESFNYIPYLISIYISIFIVYFISLIFKVLFLACIISIICMLTGVRLNFINYIKIAIYAYSLPLLFEVIAFCFGVSGRDYAYYTNLLLTYIYIIYAIRAVRLDAFIMMFSSKNIKKHTTNEFENELKKYNELVNNETSIENKEQKDEENNEKK